MVDIHGFLDEIKLLHVLRVTDAGYNFGAAQFFGEGGDNYILFVAVCGSQKKVKRSDAAVLQKFDIFSVSCDSHYVHLLRYSVKYGFVFVNYRNIVIATQKSSGNFNT